MTPKDTNLICQCGQVSLKVTGSPIVSAECLCLDCQQAGNTLQQRAGAPKIMDNKGATRFVLYRKDRVSFQGSQHLLREYYLNDKSTTRRVVASCCNTPMFLEFTAGHWLSIYGSLWQQASLPALDLRTMTRSRPTGVELPNDVPNPKTHNLSFMVKLLTAWIAMGFRSPKLSFINEKLDTNS